MVYKRLQNAHNFLMQYALDTRRQTHRNLIGGHITRRKGQSLEFHDYMPYIPGQDIRHLDFRASVRVHGASALHDPSKWLMREFSAEEHLQLFVSIDTHETMHYPQMQHLRRGQSVTNISKFQVALWLADALSFIALQSSDRIIWHPLFTPKSKNSTARNDTLDKTFVARNDHDIQVAFDGIQKITGNTSFDWEWTLNDSALERLLKPTYVWIILSDFYFQHDISKFSDRVLSAQRGNRWVILVDLDSWLYEKTLIGEGFRRLWGATIPEVNQRKLRLTPSRLAETETRIIQHKRKIFDVCSGADISTWKWPPQITSLIDFFRTEWAEDKNLRQLFMRTGT